MVSKNGLSILLRDDTLTEIKASIRQEAKNAKDEANDNRIDPDKWQAEADRLCALAERIVMPDGGIDLFDYLPLTKAGKFPKNRNIVIAESKCGYGATWSGVTNDYPTAYKLQIRLFPAYANRSDWLAGKTMADTMIMAIGLFDAINKQVPVFDENGTPREIVVTRASYLKDDEIKAGRVYEEKSGTKYLCLDGLDMIMRYTEFDGPDDQVGTYYPNGFGVEQAHVYLRWTDALAKAVGPNAGVIDVIQAMDEKAKGTPLHAKLSQRANPRKFIREITTVFDPMLTKHVKITGTRNKDPYYKNKYVQYEYEIEPFKQTGAEPG